MLAWWVSLAIVAAAQAPARGGVTPPTVRAEGDPIACWWRTDKDAVRVGERFALTLTCSVVDSPQVRVVTDEQRLSASAIELAPFEVVDATRHGEIEAPPRRYFQHTYTLRLLGDAFFGKDVDVPGLAITYNVQSTGANGTRGRDQVYLLPPLALRVLSLVPITAAGIREASPHVFGDVDRRAARGIAELAAAGALFVVAGILALVSVARAVRPRTARATSAPPGLSPPAILRACLLEAERTKAETARSGWTTDLVDRSLAISRVAGTIALGGSVAQTFVDRAVPTAEGQIAVRRSTVSAKRAVLSGSATAATLDAGLASRDAATTQMRPTLEELRDALRLLASARYGRESPLDASSLDTALDSTTRALGRLYATTRWPARVTRTLSGSFARLRGLWER